MSDVSKMKINYVKYITALLLFGSNGIVASHIQLSSYEIVFWRTMIGSAFLIAVFFISKQRLTFMNYPKSFLHITLSGIAMGASWIFLYEAYARIGVSMASLAYYCGPVIVMIVSPLLFHEKMTKFKIIGFSSVLIGIILVNGRLEVGENYWGIICGLLSALMYSLMVIFNKKSVEIKGFENAMIQLVISFLTVAVFTEIKTGYQLQMASGEIEWIIVLGLLNTGVGCYLYFSSIGHLPVQTVAICGYLEPLSAVILAMIILGENMAGIQCMGAVFIVGGAIFGEYFK